MQKICFVVSTPVTASVFLAPHFKELSKFYDIDVISNFNNFKAKPSAHFSEIQIPIFRKINLVNDLKTLIRLMYLFWTKKYVSVHSVTPKAGLLSMLAAFLTRRPNRVHWYTGQVWVNKSILKRIPLKLFDKFINFLTTKNLIDSHSQFDFLKENRVITNKSYVLANGSICGVDKNRFHPDVNNRNKIRTDLNIANSVILLLFVGRVVKDKGVFDLIESIKHLKDKNNICLLLIGADEEDNISKIYAEGLKSGIRVIHKAFSSNPEYYVQASDIFCMPSKREGFGLSVIEAAACSVPAVAYDIYGIRDAVAQNETGLLSKLGEISGLSRSIAFLIENPELRLKMGQLALERTLRLFSSEVVVSALKDFYFEHVGFIRNESREKCLNISAASLTIENFVQPFDDKLHAAGIDSLYASSFINNLDSKKFIKFPIKRGVLFPLDWLKSPKILKKIKRINPSIIVFHSPITVFTFIPILKILKKNGYKLVYIARGSLDESESKVARVLWFFIDPTAWRIWDSIGVVNKFLYSKCIKRGRKVKMLSLGGAPPNIVISKHNVITDSYDKNKIILGWMGRLDRDKRLTDFIKLVQILREKYRLNVEGRVVGAAIPGDKPGEIPVYEFIKYYGWQKNPWTILENCSLLISTSIREGYGLVSIEAGYYGIPTIAYSNHGSQKSIRETGGVLVERYNLDSLVEEVIKWNALTEVEKRKIRQVVKNRTDTLIGSANQVQELLDLYEMANRS